ncbi:phosphatase PAP2 family protein [Candidatus Gracilibacteria bacterium]|nr:phosphatase PAP2 family protein [Candidatus Gracilibacteria bacterium]
MFKKINNHHIRNLHIFIFFGLLVIFYLYQFTTLIPNLDQLINQKVNLIHTPLLTQILTLWTRIFDFKIFVLWFTLFTLFLWQNKKRNEILFLGISLILGVGLKSILKILIARPRPIDHLLESTTFSFPSGHATISTLFFLGIYLSFASKIKSQRKKKLFLSGCIFGLLSISFSRIYLHMHYLSDILAGILLGTLIIFHLSSFKESLKKTKK